MKRTTMTIAAAAAAALTLTSCSSAEMGEEGLDTVNTTSAVETETDTATETTEAEATEATATTTVAAEGDEAAKTGDVNQTELDEWFKSVIGLRTTDQFVDAAKVEGAPDWAAKVIAVTVYDNELHIETNGENQATAQEIADLYAGELKSNPPYDWGKDIKKVVVENTDGPTLAEKNV